MISLGLGLLVVAGLLVPVVAWATGRAVRSPSLALPGGMAWARFPIGVAAFIGAGMAQNLLVAPVALLIHGPHGISPLVPSSTPEALYYGLAAGVVQEGAKLAALQLYLRRDRWLAPTAVAVGAGFALAETLFVALPAFSVRLDGLGPLVLPVVERFAATLFHVGTALIICAGLVRRRPWRYLGAAIVLHAIVDGTVGLTATFDVHPMVAFEAADLIFSLAVLAAGILLVRSHADRDRPASG